MRKLIQWLVAMSFLMVVACSTNNPPANSGVRSTAGGTMSDPAPPSSTSGSGSMESGTAGMGADEMGNAAKKVDCSTVRCAACPTGQTPSLQPPNCCRCVPVDTMVKDCSNVRCAACPEGQHPALTPPDCCRCVAN